MRWGGKRKRRIYAGLARRGTLQGRLLHMQPRAGKGNAILPTSVWQRLSNRLCLARGCCCHAVAVQGLAAKRRVPCCRVHIPFPRELGV